MRAIFGLTTILRIETPRDGIWGYAETRRQPPRDEELRCSIHLDGDAVKLSLETIATFGTFASLREARDAEISIPPPPPSSDVEPETVRNVSAVSTPTNASLSMRASGEEPSPDSSLTPDSSRVPESRKANGRATTAPRRARTERPAAALRGKKAAELAERKNASPMAPTTDELVVLAGEGGDALGFGFLKTV